MLDRALGLIGPLVCLLWLGCDSEGSQPDVDGTTTSAGEEGVESSSGDPPGAEDRCAGLPGACAAEGVCEAYECGGRAAVFNHFGCPRTECGADTDCPAGEACFVAVYETSCAPGVVQCMEEADASCECSLSDDCGGVAKAHCLPTEFYPPQAYCDLESRSCEELPDWVVALELTISTLRNDGRDALVPALEACHALVTEAAEACQ